MENSELTIKKGYKQTDVGIIPEDWEVKTFGDVTDVITCGVAATPEYVNEGVGKPFLSAQNVRSGKVVYDNHKYISHKLFEQITRNNKPEKGDLLYTRVGAGIGEAGVIEDDYVFAIYVSLTLIKTNKRKLFSYFLLHLLNSPHYKFLAKNTQFAGGGVQNLNVQVVREFQLPIPPLPEQQAIAEVLSDVDALITSLDQLVTKKRNIKQGTMQLLLTGKKRLPNFSGDWETKRIGEITDATAGGTPSTQIDAYWNGNIRWMSSGELNLKIVHEVVGRITELGLQNSSTKIIPPNCILIGLAGQGRTRGTVAINKVELCTNQSIAAIYPSRNYVSEFLYHNLDNRYEELRSLSAGDSGRGGLNLTIIKNMEVELPPTIDEQKAIAQILSEMDAEIEALETQRDKYKAVKQGMMQELLTGKTRLIDNGQLIIDNEK